MLVHELQEPFNLAGSGVPRTQGPGVIHLTYIIRYIEKKLNFGPNVAKWDLDAAAEVGFMWEDVLSLVMGDRLGQRPGELTLDGIIGSPDGVGPDPLNQVPIVVEEYKCTWRSCRKLPDSVWRWQTQVRAYCKMAGTTVALFRILYLMGDYRGSGPIRKTYRVEYTQDEINETWQMILAHRDEAAKWREQKRDDSE